MEDIINAFTGFLASLQVANIAFDKVEALPLFGGDEGFNFVEITLVTGGKVVQPNYTLAEFKQGLQQVGADKAGYAGDEPGFRGSGKFLQQRFVRRHGLNSVCVRRAGVLAAFIKEVDHRYVSGFIGPSLRVRLTTVFTVGDRTLQRSADT